MQETKPGCYWSASSRQVVFHLGSGRRQLAAGVQHILKFDQQLGEGWQYAANAQKNAAPAPRLLGLGGGSWECPHAPCIDQLPANCINHQVVMLQEISPQDRELHVREEKNPGERNPIEGESQLLLPPAADPLAIRTGEGRTRQWLVRPERKNAIASPSDTKTAFESCYLISGLTYQGRWKRDDPGWLIF